jgi:inosine-uridine nucleoside N-ribohydrolase
LLRSPEVQVLGVTTGFQDTHLRARLAERFLKASGRGDVPVYEGPKTAAGVAFHAAQMG